MKPTISARDTEFLSLTRVGPAPNPFDIRLSPFRNWRGRMEDARLTPSSGVVSACTPFQDGSFL